MFTYNVDGQNYTYTKEIGQDEAEKRVRAFKERIAQAQKQKDNPEYEGFFTEAGEGVVSGLTKIPEGIISLGTLGYDAISGGRSTDLVEAWFDNLREDLGVDPQGAAGKVTEAIVQFGIPGLGAASAVSKVGKLATGAKGLISKPLTAGTSKLLGTFAPKAKKALTNVERRRRIREGIPEIGVKNPRIRSYELGQQFGQIKRGRDAAKMFEKKPTILGLPGKVRTKAQKVGRYATMLGAAGLADAIVSTDDTQTIGDFFDAGYTNTVDAVGLDGQERAFAKLANKLKVGLEGGVAMGVLPPALGASFKVLNKTLGARPIEGIKSVNETLGNFAGKVLPENTTVLDIASGMTVPLARGIIDTSKRAIAKREELLTKGEPGEISSLQGFIGKIESLLRYRGFLDPIVARARSLINPEVEGNIKIAKQKMQEIDDKIQEILKTPRFTGLPDHSKRKYVDNFMDVLEGARKNQNLRGLSRNQQQVARDKANKITDLPDELYNLYVDAANMIKTLSDQFVASKVIQDLPDDAVIQGNLTRQQFENQVERMMREGGYLRRLYRIYNDKNYKIQPQAREEIVQKILAREGTDLGHIRGILSETPMRISDQQMDDIINGGATLTRQQAEAYIKKVVANAKAKGGNRGIGLNRLFQTRLDTSLLNKRKVDSEVLRQILGEVRDPREAFISTVSELSNFIATDRFLSLFKQSADANIASVAARNAARATEIGFKPEKQVFYKMDDEIIKYIKERATTYEVNPDQISRIGQLDEKLLGKALDDWLSDNPNHVILGRSGETTVARDAYSPGANQTSSIYGTMFGYAVPRVMFNNLSNHVWTDADTMPTLLRKTYGMMQTLKGATQYAKTILSPLTQVRNVTSASGFAIAQGNYGKGSSLGTSVNVVLRDAIDKELKIKGKTFIDLNRDNETLEFLVEMQKRGVIGSSAQLREIQENLRKGLGYEGSGGFVQGLKEFDERGLALTQEQRATRQLGQSDPSFNQEKRSKLGQFFRGPLGFAEDLYRGGDDIWKIYNYLFELQKFRNARRKMQSAAITKVKKQPIGTQGRTFDDLNAEQQNSLIAGAVRDADREFGKYIGAKPDAVGDELEEAFKQFTADNIRNLVPNYELVPDVIKGLRGLPLGNFIAFPAEILRTGFNTLDVAMKELASDSAAIREIGSRRLTNSLFTFGVLGEGLQRFGQMMTDTSDEEIDAINRLSAPWQRNSMLIPVGRDEKGNPEVIDFSYTNPWDMLSKPFHTVARSMREGARLDKGDLQKIGTAAFDALGEFFSPFFEVSMIYDAALDVLPKESVLGLGVGRGGRTRSGAKVYKEGDGLGLSLEKSLVHILDALKPNILPIRVPTGADLGITRGQSVKSPELGRTARGVFFPEGGEFLGFNIKAEEPTTGREYTTAGELFRAFTGLQSQVIDRDKIAEFKAQEFKGLRSEAATLFTDALRLEDPTKEQMLEAYLRADDARLKAFREMKLNYDSLKRIGLTDTKIAKILKQKAGIGNKEIFSLRADRYIPYLPSKERLKQAVRKKIKVPYSTIMRLYRKRFGMKLTPDEPVKPIKKEAKDFLNLTNLSTQGVNTELPKQTTQTQTQPLDVTNVNTMLLNPSPENRQIAQFLGGNPEQILKNMEIARRTV
jgi:hypothetical protein